MSQVTGIGLQAMEASGIRHQAAGPAPYALSRAPDTWSLAPPPPHDYHLSNVEIEYNAKAQALQIIMHIFIDDLEDAIANAGVEQKLYLCTDREVEDADQYISDYISSKFAIMVDDKPVDYVFLGKETSPDIIAMDCYLEVEDLTSASEIAISNDLLMEVFEDQVNIIKLKSTLTGKKGFMMLKKGSHSDIVQL